MEERRVEAEGIMFTLFDQERETEIYHRELEEQLTEQITAKVTEQVAAEVTAQARAADAAQIAKSLGLSIDQAMDALAIPQEDRKRIASLVMAG